MTSERREEGKIVNDEWKEKFLAETELWVPLKWRLEDPTVKEGDNTSGQL